MAAYNGGLHACPSMVSTNQNKTWNQDSTKPVTCSLAVLPTQTQCEVVRSAQKVLQECAQCLSQNKGLRAEFCVLNRLVYMKHGQLRREKSFQGLKQIKLCLKKFLALGLDKNMKEMSSHFEDAVVLQGVRVYLPSRQMWEHLLTQVMGATALLTSTASRCATVFLHVHRHLAAGMLIPSNMVFLSMLSRIWACCQGLCLDMQSWYRLLEPVTDVLKPTEVPWLPEGEGLPADLSGWLREQGFTSGLSHHTRDDNDEDMVASLMAEYQLQGKSDEEDDRPEPSLDNTMPATEEEDFGDPVDVREVETRIGEQDPDQTLPTLSKKTNLKEKIKLAQTIQDLQRILRKFQKKCSSVATKEKAQQCSACLTVLQTRSQALERKGKQARVQDLLVQGRKKLRAFFKSVTSKSTAVDTNNGQRQSPLSAKKGKKKNRAGKKAGGNRQPDIAPESKEKVSISLKKREKNHPVPDTTKDRKKRKKNSKKGTEKERGLGVISAGKKNKLEGRRRKKNDPVNNKMKAAQVKQKKNKARKV